MQEPEVHPFSVARDAIKKGDIFEYREIRQKSKILVDHAEAKINPGEGIQSGHVVTRPVRLCQNPAPECRQRF